MAALDRFAGKLRRFAALPAAMQGWFALTWLLLGVSRAAILLLSFRLLAPRLGRLNADGAWVIMLDREQEARAEQLKRLVHWAARHTPWSSNCFAQAVTARVLLGMHGIPFSLCLGVTHDRETRGLQAHAWVVAGRVAVSGGVGFDRYTVVACFSSPLH